MGARRGEGEKGGSCVYQRLIVIEWMALVAEKNRRYSTRFYVIFDSIVHDNAVTMLACTIVA